MTDYMTVYKRWMECADEATKSELEAIASDEEEIKSRFYRTLEFGTGGLRGVIGAGTNRINNYVVAQATQGLANQLLQSANQHNAAAAKEHTLCVVIAYDSRHKSDEFAKEAATVLAANGIKVYLFDELRPTPELSFTVRHKGADAGIVITASHNPAKYNGYKAYGSDGSQINLEVADVILSQINSIDIFNDVKRCNFEEAKSKGLIEIISEDVDSAYLANVAEQSMNRDLIKTHGGDFKLVYTPFHGAGNKPVRRIFDMVGFKNVLIVKQQEQPDGAFPTVKSPNPEEKEGFTLAIRLAKENDVDLIIATDPDSDRVGIAVLNNGGEYVTMTGNQVGILLTEYILSNKKQNGTLPKNGAVISTIVSSNMTRAITEHYGAELMEVLTGFKFIGEKIKEFESTHSHEYLFGFEESYGYLAGTYTRDKDAVVASMLIAEMALYYKQQGITLYEQMERLYKKYGYYMDEIISVTLEGIAGIEKIQSIMADLRSNPPSSIGGKGVIAMRDYKTSKRTDIKSQEQEDVLLPKSDVLYFELEDDSDFVVRPSGTEPKIKFYLKIKGEKQEIAAEACEKMRKFIRSITA